MVVCGFFLVFLFRWWKACAGTTLSHDGLDASSLRSCVFRKIYARFHPFALQLLTYFKLLSSLDARSCLKCSMYRLLHYRFWRSHLPATILLCIERILKILAGLRLVYFWVKFCFCFWGPPPFYRVNGWRARRQFERYENCRHQTLYFSLPQAEGLVVLVSSRVIAPRRPLLPVPSPWLPRSPCTYANDMGISDQIIRRIWLFFFEIPPHPSPEGRYLV